MSLNYKTYFRHVHKLKNNLYLRPFNIFSFKESSTLNIMYVFIFVLVLKLYNSGLQVTHLNLDHLRSFNSVDI